MRFCQVRVILDGYNLNASRERKCTRVGSDSARVTLVVPERSPRHILWRRPFRHSVWLLHKWARGGHPSFACKTSKEREDTGTCPADIDVARALRFRRVTANEIALGLPRERRSSRSFASSSASMTHLRTALACRSTHEGIYWYFDSFKPNKLATTSPTNSAPAHGLLQGVEGKNRP